MISVRIIALCVLFIFRWRFPKNKSIAEIVEKYYGKEAVKSIRKYEKLDFKRRKVEIDLSFLQACLSYDVTPKFCMFKTSNRNLRNSTTYDECQKKLLKEEIKIKEDRQTFLTKELRKKEEELSEIFLYIDFIHISSMFINSNKAAIKKIENLQNIKLEELVCIKQGHDSKKVIFNYSSYTLDKHETTLLSKGLNFAIPPKKVKFDNHILPFELLYRDIRNLSLPNEKLISLKSKVENIGLSSFYSYNKKEHKFENISQEEYEAFLKLAENNDIIIQQADKGNNTVILNKTDYIQKMENILGDISKFQEVNFKHSVNKELRHLLDIEKIIKNTLKDLLENISISKQDYEKLIPTGSQPGVLYGCTKVHKNKIGNCPPLRPILNAIGTPSYNIAKFLVSILEPLTTNEFTIKNSFSFAENIRSQNSKYIMASLDVDSLFTNIPLDETIDICIKELFKNNTNVNNLTKDEMKSLLTSEVKTLNT